MTSLWALHTLLVSGPPHGLRIFSFSAAAGKSRESCSYDFPLFPPLCRPHRCRVPTSHPCVSHGLGKTERGAPHHHHQTYGNILGEWVPHPATPPPMARWVRTAPLCQYPPSMVPALCFAMAPPLWRPVLSAPRRGAPVPRIETRFAIFITSPFLLRQIMATKMVEVCAGLVSLCFALLLLVGTKKLRWFDCGRCSPSPARLAISTA